MLPEIYTRSGRYFDLLNPDPNEIDIADIASALSKITRFTGHGRFAYSVAEHSVHCSHLVPPEFALEALLHDAQEAYLGDVSSPLKSLLPDYRRLENRLAERIAYRFGLPTTLSPQVKLADLQMLKIEKEVVLGCFDDWEITSNITVTKRPTPRGWTPHRAYSIFMERFDETFASCQRRAG